MQRRKLQAKKQAYSNERLRERESLDKDLSALDKQLQESMIDSQTHERYMKILQISYERKRQETRKKFGFEASAR